MSENETEAVAGSLALLLAAAKPAAWPVRETFIPSWGRSVYLREITAGERDHIEGLTSYARERPQSVRGKFRATFCAYFLSDEEGRRIVSDADIPKIDSLGHSGLEEVYRAGIEFNHLSADTYDELEKN